MARFWDPTEGAIQIGGVNIKDIPLTELADQVSFVTQDNFLFNCSILENIRLGNPQATDEQVLEAARKAQATNLSTSWNRGISPAQARLETGCLVVRDSVLQSPGLF